MAVQQGGHRVFLTQSGRGAGGEALAGVDIYQLTGVELGQETLVVDTTRPTITNVTASPNTLGPPNHKMVNITIATNVNDDSGLPVTLSAAVSSNEL